MKKYEVEYQGGESRESTKAIDYMLCMAERLDEDGDMEEVELYAELENPTWDEEKEV